MASAGTDRLRPDLILIDGKNLLWRSLSSHSLSIEVDGESVGTGGIYGFLGVAIRVWQKYHGRIVVCWEGKTNFRKRLWPGYKLRKEDAERDLRTAELEVQRKHLTRILKAMGVSQYRGVDCEADDVIGRLSRLGANGRQVLIYSGDSDLRQLVSKSVVVVAPGQGPRAGVDTVYTRRKVEEVHGVPPRLLPDLKALCGDSSDCIPGAPGVGPTFAARLLQHYGGLPTVLDAAAAEQCEDWPVREALRGKISVAREDVELYWKLTRIRRKLPMKAIEPARDQQELLHQLKRFKFHSFLHSPVDLGALQKLGRACSSK